MFCPQDLVASLVENDLLERSNFTLKLGIFALKLGICRFNGYYPVLEGRDMAPQFFHFMAEGSLRRGLCRLLPLLFVPLGDVQPVGSLLHYKAMEAPHNCAYTVKVCGPVWG